MGLLSYFTMIGLALISYISYSWMKYEERESGKVTVAHVWFYGWLTAISTGLGAIPFYFVKKPTPFFMAVSNGILYKLNSAWVLLTETYHFHEIINIPAIAAGMMIAASCSLIYEGAYFDGGNFLSYPPIAGVTVGCLIGVLFILITKRIVDSFGDKDATDFQTVSAKKIFIIVFVMTLHSLTEGIGIGVSFGGKSGSQLGQFISFSLAVHNVPEGLAVALVCTARGVSNIRSALWAIFTSLPQPIMAIPAFIFVERFVPLLPLGLGFAAGAMFYVAIFELLLEALEEMSVFLTGVVGSLSCLCMLSAQSVLKGAI